MDEVVEAPYCVVCRRSSAVKWRKHVFSRGHQQAAQQFLLLQVSRLQTLCDAATSDSTTANNWRCVFCDAALILAEALAHFSSEKHKKQVKAFCCHHRCDAERQIRCKLWLQAARRRELEAALTRADGEKKQEKATVEVVTVDQAANERVEVFLSSAALRLQEVQAHRCRVVKETSGGVTPGEQEALLGPQLTVNLTGGRRCKTIASAEGVLQNPLGRHEGKRVWGGGIVKLRKTEWIPWAIDQLVKEEQTDHLETQHTGVDNTIFAHRVTEVARGEGLSSIASVSWGASVGNIHTAAVPPWMVQTEEEYKKCNRREQTDLALQNHKTEKNKKRRIFSELQSKSEYGSDWLPNFGGVWQEGPRSKTKQAFKKAANTAKSSWDPHPAVKVQDPESQAFTQQAQPLLPRLPPREPAILLSKTQQEVPILPLPELGKDDKNESINPLDAKKRLLLAQKERLRAKMAARRRQ